MASLSLQTLLKSAWAEPYLLGLSSWSCTFLTFMKFISLSLGFSQIIWWQTPLKHLSLFLGCFLGLSLLLSSRSFFQNKLETLFLIGFASNAISAALTSLFNEVGDQSFFFDTQRLLFGQTPLNDWNLILFSFFTGSISFLILMKKLPSLFFCSFDASMFFQKQTSQILSLIALITACSLPLIGSVGFVGIILPSYLKAHSWQNVQTKWIMCYLGGGSIYAFAHWLGQMIYPPYELSGALMISLFLGPPFFFKLTKRPLSKIKKEFGKENATTKN